MRSEKELAAGLRALHTNNDDTRAFLRTAADYIERTAAPADELPGWSKLAVGSVAFAKVRIDTDPSDDGWCFCTPANPPEDVARGLMEEWEESSQFFGQVVAAAAPADLVLETTEEERGRYQAKEGSVLASQLTETARFAHALLRDFNTLTAALAAANERAASETKRADGLTLALVEATEGRDREAAARREAEAERATLRAALEKVHRSLDAEISMWRCACPHPCEDYLVHPGPCGTRTAESFRNIDVIARAALATTSTGEGS